MLHHIKFYRNTNAPLRLFPSIFCLACFLFVFSSTIWAECRSSDQGIGVVCDSDAEASAYASKACENRANTPPFCGCIITVLGPPTTYSAVVLMTDYSSCNTPCCKEMVVAAAASSHSCAESNDPCCGGGDPCCDKPDDPCCADPICCGDPCCEMKCCPADIPGQAGG
jgi:hypothetical protein